MYARASVYTLKSEGSNTPSIRFSWFQPSSNLTGDARSTPHGPSALCVTVRPFETGEKMPGGGTTATYQRDRNPHRRLRHAAWKGDLALAKQMVAKGGDLAKAAELLDEAAVHCALVVGPEHEKVHSIKADAAQLRAEAARVRGGGSGGTARWT